MLHTIEFDSDELSVAELWHGGQSSMLYAIASTGALSLGTIRPTDENGEWLSDQQWFTNIANRLASEAEHCATLARRQDEHDDAMILDEIARKCEMAIDNLEVNP